MHTPNSTGLLFLRLSLLRPIMMARRSSPLLLLPLSLLMMMLLVLIQPLQGFLLQSPKRSPAIAPTVSHHHARAAAAPLSRRIAPLMSSLDATSRQDTVKERLAMEWELDCYSRPVIGEDGKKLWELLICDSLGDFRAVETMPSNMVNSRELRKLVEKVSNGLSVCIMLGGRRSVREVRVPI